MEGSICNSQCPTQRAARAPSDLPSAIQKVIQQIGFCIPPISLQVIDGMRMARNAGVQFCGGIGFSVLQYRARLCVSAVTKCKQDSCTLYS